MSENPVFKCGRCHHVFPRFPGAPTAERVEATRQRTSAPPAPDNLEFIFPRRPELTDPGMKGVVPPDTIAALRELASEPPRAAEALVREAERYAERRQASAEVLDDTPDSVTSLASPCLDEDAFMADLLMTDRSDDDAAAAVELSDDFDHARDDETPEPAPVAAARVMHVEAPMRGRTPIAAFPAVNRWLVTLVVAHTALALFLRFDPERGQGWLERIPLVGTALSGRAAIGRQISLHNVRGVYQRLRNDRLVFVISGEAINNSQAPIERLQVEGALYDTTGEVDRKVISTGNETTLKLTELSESEIALLQRFEPRTRLAPGERVSFSIVFLEPPRNLREFSSRVLTARPTGRGSSPSMDRAGAPASVG